MMIGMIAQTAYNLADAIWVSGLGADALAAVGLFFPFIFLFMAIANGIGIGGSSAISRMIGANDKKSADKIAMQMISLGIIAAFVTTGIFLPFLNTIFVKMGAGKVAPLAMSYGKILLIGSVFLFYSSICNAILRGEGDTKRVMYAMLISSILNIVLDPIFIYVFKLGVAGAAWATLASILSTSILFTYWLFFKKNTYVTLSFANMKFSRKIIAEILSVGIPASFIQLSNSLMMFFMNIIVVKADGTDGVAVLTSGLRIITIGTIPLLGMAMGVTAVTGAAYGAKNAKKLDTSYLFGLKIGFIIEIFIASLIFIFARQITTIFTYSSASARLADNIVIFLRWMILFLPFVPFGMLTSAMFQGVHKGFYALLTTITRTIILNLPLAYIFAISMNFHLKGIWWGMIVGNSLTGVFAFILGRFIVAKFRRDFVI